MISYDRDEFEEGNEVGRRVREVVRQIDSDALAEFSHIDVTNIADAQHGYGAMSEGIRWLAGADDVTGLALPVTVTPGDGRMIRVAIAMAEPGDVIVVNASGNTDRAVLGGNVLMAAAARGVRAMIIDGAIRDVGEAAAVGIGLFARASVARSGSTPGGVGEVGYDVACGGVVVHSGDVVRAGLEGVVITPHDSFKSVVSRALEVERRKGSSNDISTRMRDAGATLPDT